MKNKRYFILLLACTLIFSTHLCHAAITVAVSPSSDRILPGSVRTVCSNVQGATASNVTWSSTSGTTQESNGYFIRWKAPTTPGTYTITATSAEDTGKRANATFTVISDAVVKISNVPAQTTAYKNQPVIIQSILWGSTNTNVTWSNSGGNLTGDGREVVFSANAAGTYTVTATSSADKSKTATTTIVVTANEHPVSATANKTQPVDCTPTGTGSTYNVTTEAEMDAVPWASLGPGDTVRIHPGTYHKQILLSTSGTETQPIRVCGVRDSNGNLPELNGANATAKTGTNYSSSYSLQGYAGILIHKRDVQYFGGAVYPKNIIIEGLKITGYHPSNKFFDIFTGASTAYVSGAAPIRIQHGADITVRGNDLSDCGNGLFSMSNNGTESWLTRNLLVEGNYFHNNGVNGSYREHQSYLQAFGLVVQGNYYDFPLVGMTGGQLKTRSLQQFVRYNYFETSARVIDLVEIQDDTPLVFPWIGLQASELVNTSTSDVVANNEAYNDRFVYGNIIKNIGQTAAAWIIHGAADNDQTYNPGGTLYFYHNNVWTSLKLEESSSYRAGIIDFGPYGTTIGDHNVWPTARITNNAIYIAQSTPSSGRLFFWNRYKADRVFLDRNWISTGWGNGNVLGGDGTGISNTTYAGQWQGGTIATQVTGTSNLITNSSSSFDLSTYSPAPGGALIQASDPLPNELATLPPLMKYERNMYRMSRRKHIQDIGAIDFGAPSPTINKIILQ